MGELVRWSSARHGEAFREERERDAEGGVRGFGAGDGLEEEIERSAVLHGLHLRGDVGEDAVLRGDGVAGADLVDEAQQGGDGCHVVGDGVDADDGVAGAEEQTVEDAGGDSCGIVGGVVGLQACGEAAGQTDGRAEARDDRDLARDGDEILQAHELGDGGGHLGHQSG